MTEPHHEDPLLSVRNLKKHYPITEGLLRRETGRVRAVDGVSFDIAAGEAFGLVGESGCGKSTTALSVLHLEEPTGGTVRFDGERLGEFGRRDRKQFRRRVQLVMQDPDSAFNPRMTVGETVAEPLQVHGMTDSDRRQRIVADTLEQVGLSGSAADSYPHEFSGGEKQRIALARALVLNPDLLVADEPVSALDGRTKADVLSLMNDLQEAFDLSILLISHDIDVVRQFCDRVAVMYLGRIVETGPTDEIVTDPHHPYTQILLSSVPSLDPDQQFTENIGDTLTDDLPDATDLPDGCRFHPRCPAIIPPAERSLTADEWRGVVALRFYLADDWTSVDHLRASLADGDTLKDQLRETFSLGDPIPDDAVEAALEDAVEALQNGSIPEAGDCLSEVTRTVCERETPTLRAEQAAHEVACHRYDPDKPGRAETDILTSD